MGGEHTSTPTALQNPLHRARDLPDALFDQRWRLADVRDGLAAIVEDAKIL